MSSKVGRLKMIIDHLASQGVRLDPVKHVFVVPTDCAIVLVREILNTHGRIDGVCLSPDEDELFKYRGFSVKLRNDAPPDQATVIARSECDPPSCCDMTSYRAVAMALSRERA